MRVSIVLISLLLIGALAAGAQQEDFTPHGTAGEYFDICKLIDLPPADHETAIKITYCNGYFEGVQTGLNLSGGLDKGFFCLPESGTADEMAHIFVKYVRDNPKVMHEHISVALILAFRDAYPCPPKKR